MGQHQTRRIKVLARPAKRQHNNYHKRNRPHAVRERMKFRPRRERGEYRQLAIPAKKASEQFPIFLAQSGMTLTLWTLLRHLTFRYLATYWPNTVDSALRNGIWLATCTKQIWEISSRENKQRSVFQENGVNEQFLKFTSPKFWECKFCQESNSFGDPSFVSPMKQNYLVSHFLFLLCLLTGVVLFPSLYPGTGRGLSLHPTWSEPLFHVPSDTIENSQ